MPVLVCFRVGSENSGRLYVGMPITNASRLFFSGHDQRREQHGREQEDCSERNEEHSNARITVIQEDTSQEESARQKNAGTRQAG